MFNNVFDLAIVQWVNDHASSVAGVNNAVSYATYAYLVKGIPIMGAVWYFWFKDTSAVLKTRRLIIAILIGCFTALIVARVLNIFTPHQSRPFANPAMAFHPLAGLPAPESQVLFDWNSFPSDHAAMFFAIATGIFLISRRAGCLAFLYVTFFIALPRVYLGLHYPTDILAGAGIGISGVWLSTRTAIEAKYGKFFMRLMDEHPAAFQTALFAVTVEMIVMFDDVRRLLNGIVHHLLR